MRSVSTGRESYPKSIFPRPHQDQAGWNLVMSEIPDDLGSHKRLASKPYPHPVATKAHIVSSTGSTIHTRTHTFTHVVPLTKCFSPKAPKGTLTDVYHAQARVRCCPSSRARRKRPKTLHHRANLCTTSAGVLWKVPRTIPYFSGMLCSHTCSRSFKHTQATWTNL